MIKEMSETLAAYDEIIIDLQKENSRLRQSETEAQEIIAELESKLEEYKKFGLDKDLKELEKLK